MGRGGGKLHLIILKILFSLLLPVCICTRTADTDILFSVQPLASMPVCGGAPWLGFCLQQAGSSSAEMQGMITQRKAPHRGSFSSYGRKEVKITAEVAVFHTSESDLFCFTDFTFKGKKRI